MIRKITLLNIVGKHVLGPTLTPQLKIHRWCVQMKFLRWANNSTSTVETLVLVQCWVNVSTPSMTCCQQLQPLPNVGPTIACFLGKLSDIIITTFLKLRINCLQTQAYFVMYNKIGRLCVQVESVIHIKIGIGITYIFDIFAP